MRGHCRQEFRHVASPRGGRTRFLLLLATLLLPSQTGLASSDGQPVDFRQQVRPLLADTCFQCHGPDSKTRMAGLRLDLRESVLTPRRAGAPLVPGDPEKSLIYQRVVHPDAARRMPPKQAHKELSADQIELIRRWIEEGGRWEEHWSFAPVVRPQPPAVRKQDWVRNPIDRFILARLESAGLDPAPEADRRTLARRASLDITGLPPQPQQVEALVRDESPAAYAEWIDRLMESEAYGEHRARTWLDAARYADTHGLHYDNYREIWPYRDWVIGAFNRNLPFDRFTVEQIAGDLLPNPTPDQVVATGFHRCNITTSEGGSIDAEVEAMYAKDRVDTTGAVWLGLTVGCATCHDQKFDPITQRDYYSMAAFFRNNAQKAMDGNFFATPPVVVVPAREDGPRWEASKAAAAVSRHKLEEIRAASEDDFQSWLESDRPRVVDWSRFDASERMMLDLSTTAEVRLDGTSVPLQLHQAASVNRQESPSFLVLTDQSFAQVPPFVSLSADRGFTISVSFRLREGGETGVLASQVLSKQEGRGWTLALTEGRPQVTLTADNRNSMAMAAAGDRKAEPGRWHHVAVSYDGLRHRSGLRLYLDGTMLPTTGSGTAAGRLEGSIRVEAPLLVGATEGRDGAKSSFLDGDIRQLLLLDRSVSETETRLLASWDLLEHAWTQRPDQIDNRQRQALRWYYLMRHHPLFADTAAQLQRLQQELGAMERRSGHTLVMTEKPDSEPMAYVLHRGICTIRNETRSAPPHPPFCRPCRLPFRATGWVWPDGWWMIPTP